MRTLSLILVGSARAMWPQICGGNGQELAGTRNLWCRLLMVKYSGIQREYNNIPKPEEETKAKLVVRERNQVINMCVYPQ